MKTTFTKIITCLSIAALSQSLLADISKTGENSYNIKNASLGRTLTTENGHLMTKSLQNFKADQTLTPLKSNEFRLRLSTGTELKGSDFILTNRDFKVVDTQASSTKGFDKLTYKIRNNEHGISIDIVYSLKKNEPYMRKQLFITADKEICLEHIDIDAIAFEDAHQPYTIEQMDTLGKKRTPDGKWRPNLGQPLFTTKTATFWGTEFPASYNHVENQQLLCGYAYGHKLKPGQTLATYKTVVGVSDDSRYTSDAFYAYIDQIRARPLRLQTQYNSWFDYGQGVNRKSFIESVNKVNEELCQKRGVSPFKAYVIDDGWQDSKKKSDWSQKVWTVNKKFDSNFKNSFSAVKEAQSQLGLWLSPGCNFGAKRIVPQLRDKGLGGLTNWMSLANTKYMDMLEERMTELTKQGVTYFKLDGTFGHLYIRDFDFNPENGLPPMPKEMHLEKMRHDDKRLNQPQYDEFKRYYMTVGSERMMKIFAEMHKINPEVYIVISNGAYLSPWWMMHCDAVWMINAGDAAGGAGRTGELVYRDGIYHDIWQKENTFYPMNSLFNHEPKKKTFKESPETFRNYLYMNMSRGTGFVELYIKTFKLAQTDWDVLAEGMHWVEDVFPTFKRVRMHGGDPKQKDVYGFTAWNKTRGYVSLHNPAKEEKTYTFKLNRDFGLIPGQKSYFLSSPLADSLQGLKTVYNFGDSISIALKPGEIRILNFDNKMKDWTKLRKLQAKTIN